MTHEERLTNTGAGQCDIQSLVWNTTFCDVIEVFKIKWESIFHTVVKIKSIIRVVNIIMTNIGIEAYCQCVRQYLWYGILRKTLVLSINNVDGFHDGKVDSSILTPLLCTIQ